jgi:outer membrane protein insertion porin family
LRGFDVRTVSPVVFVPTLTSTPFTFSNPTSLGSGGPTLTTLSIPTLSYQTSFPGGDTQAVINLEYRIPIAPHVSTSLFFDTGATGSLQHDQLQLNQQDFTTLSQTFPVTSFSRELQYQPGTNFKLRASAGIELVVQLPIVQAPFRIYWAYNFERMSQVITAPPTQFPGNVALADPTKPPCSQALTTGCFDMNWAPYVAGLPPLLWNTQIVPQLQSAFNNPQRTNFFDPVRTFKFTVSRTF